MQNSLESPSITLVLLAMLASSMIIIPSFGLTCDQGKIVLTSQSSLDNFSEIYGNCSEIEGDLEISGSDIADLQQLESIEVVRGDLIIWNNPILETLVGLSNVTSVYGLAIWQNASLKNINGLKKISGEILYDVDISFNDNLSNLTGLTGVNTVAGSIYIERNSKLENLNGFNNLSSAGGFFIWDNAELNSLYGLERLKELKFDLSIIGNPKLSDCASISLLLGWPDGPPSDDVVGRILLHDNSSTCSSIDEILSSAPYSGTDRLRIPGTACRLEDNPEEPALRQNEKGIFNLSEDNVEVTCPIYLKVQGADSDGSRTVTDISLNYAPQNNPDHELYCNLFEYAGNRLIRKLTGEKSKTSPQNQYFWTQVGISDNLLSSFSVTCSVPPSFGIEEVEIRTLY